MAKLNGPKPPAPRTKSTGTRELMPKVTPLGTPKPTRKSGVTVAIRKGVTMDLKTGVKTTAKATPKPIKTKSDAQYLSDQKKFIASQKKSK